MDFKVANTGVNIKVNTYNNISNDNFKFNANTNFSKINHKMYGYEDIPEIDFNKDLKSDYNKLLTATGSKISSKTSSVTVKSASSAATGVKKVASSIVSAISGLFGAKSSSVSKVKTSTKTASASVKTSDKSSGFLSSLGKLAKSINNGLKNTGAKITKTVSAIGDGISKTKTAAVETVSKIKTKIDTSLKNVGAKFTNVTSKISDSFSKLKTSASNLVNKIDTGLKNAGAKIANVTSKVFTMENIEKVVSSGVDALKRTSASIVNGVVAFGEGLVSFGEAIVDAGIMIGGAVHSVRTAGSDIATGLLTGDWSFSKTKATWTDKIMPAIAYNATDKMFDTLYDTKFMKNVEKNSYDAMKREGGGVYNFVKDVGYYTGVTLVSTVTLGGGALPTALTVGTASLGRNAQKNYGAVLDNAAKTGNEITWADIGKATGQTVSTAVVDGAVGYLAGNLKGLENSATTFGQKVLTGWLGPAGLQSGKVFVSEAINCAWTGEEYDFAETVKEAAAVITAETICFGVGEGIDFVKNKDMAGKVDDGLRAVLTFGDKLKQRVVKAVGKIGDNSLGDAVEQSINYALGDDK